MFSKKLGVIFGLSLMLGACNLPLNENPPAPSDINAKLDGSACLEEAMPALESFIQGTGSPNQIIGFWDCLSTAVSSFEKSTRGRYEDRFTALELVNFVERYFMSNGEKISPALQLEIFKMKQLFMGGNDQSITRDEMRIAIQVFEQLKIISVRMNPYMKVYSMNWKTADVQSLDSDMKYFEDANLEIQQASKDVADIIAKNGRAYKLESFVLLLTELSKFSDSPWSWLAKFDDAMPLVYQLKKALAGGKEAEVEPTEWRRFFLLSSRGYIQYLRYFYFISEASGKKTLSQNIVYITRSVDDLFSYLGDMVEGKQEKTLTRSELLNILQALTKFVPDLKVTDSFLIELMKIKRIFFGGRIDYFEKADFDRARIKLETFRLMAEEFLTYAKVYGMEWIPAEGLTADEKLAYFRKAETGLVNFATTVGENLENSYDLNDLNKLAKELDTFFGPPEKPETPTLEARAKKLVPLLITGKNVILDDSDSLVGTNNRDASRALWKDFLSFSAQGFARYLYYNYFVAGQKISTGSGIKNMQTLLNETSDYLEKMLSRKAGQTITFAEFGKVWKSLQSAEFLPEKMTASALDKVTKALFQRMLLSPERRLSGVKPNGLTKESLSVLKTEFAIWGGSQEFLDWLYSNVPAGQGRPKSQILAAIGANPTSEGLKEMNLIYGSGLEVSFDLMGRMVIGKPAAYYLRETADNLNLVRAAARLVMRGYASDMTRIKNYGGVSEAELKILFADLKELLVQLEMIGPNNKNFAESRFRDGNLFTSVSNGDDFMDFKESVQLVMMITSGLKLDSVLYKELDADCRINESSKDKDEWTVDYNCMANVYKPKLPTLFASMPDLVWYMKRMSKTQYDTFFANMVKAAGYSSQLTGSLVKMKDLSQFPHVTQYVEMIFQKFDTDRNGFLDTGEAMKAFPTFRNILLTASNGKLKKEKDLKGLFTWLLKYGKPPGGLMKNLKFILIWVPKGEKGWDVWADREKLATILGVIAEETARAELSAL